MLHRLDFGQCLTSLQDIQKKPESNTNPEYSNWTFFQQSDDIPPALMTRPHVPTRSSAGFWDVNVRAFLQRCYIKTAHVCMKASKGTVRLSRKMSDHRAMETPATTRRNSAPHSYQRIQKQFQPTSC